MHAGSPLAPAKGVQKSDWVGLTNLSKQVVLQRLIFESQRAYFQNTHVLHVYALTISWVHVTMYTWCDYENEYCMQHVITLGLRHAGLLFKYQSYSSNRIFFEFNIYSVCRSTVHTIWSLTFLLWRVLRNT